MGYDVYGSTKRFVECIEISTVFAELVVDH
jgi:hypothetical protein